MTFLANIPHNLFYLLVFLVVLLVLVGAHEYGHYLFARVFGMGAEEFSLGMGGKPWVVGRRRYLVPIAPYEDPSYRGEENRMEGGDSTAPAEIVETPNGLALRETTLFTLRPYPIGGFVRIKGMMPEEDGAETRIPGGFFSKAPWKRWVVLAAGPAFSVLAGIVLLVPGLTFYGLPKVTGRPVLGGLQREGAAYRAGLRPNDRIVSIDGVPTATWFDIVKNVREKGTNPIHVVADRAGKPIDLTFPGKVDKEVADLYDKDGKKIGEAKQTRLGALPESKVVPLSFRDSVLFGLLTPIDTVWGLASRVTHPAELKESVGGPATMVTATAAAVDDGIWAIFRLAGLLSISVGIFNLLPFPPLDGGQMWIATIEMFRGGRRLSMKTQMRAMQFGFTMVLLLICTVLVIDGGRVTGIDKPSIVEGKE